MIILFERKNLENSVHDIGVGRGLKLIDIVEFIGEKKLKIKKINKTIDEVDVSIASNDYHKNFKFSSLEKYFQNKLNHQKKSFIIISKIKTYYRILLRDI